MNDEQLNFLNSSPVELNWGDDVLGKLYLFPVSESELKARGIEKQWFLTHQRGDRLVSGHINQDNQWSLCHPRDLTPTHDYYAPDELWEFLAGDDFVAGLNSPNQVKSNDRSVETTRIADADDSSEDQPRSDAIKVEQTEEKEAAINLSQTPLSSLSLDEDAEEEAETETEELEVKAENQISEEQRQLLEQDLRILLWQGYQSDLLDLDNQEVDQPWMIELDGDDIKLTSTVDRHTVLAIAKTGEIKHHLSLADADLLIDSSVREKDSNQQIDWDLFNQHNQQQPSQGLEIE